MGIADVGLPSVQEVQVVEPEVPVLDLVPADSEAPVID